MKDLKLRCSLFLSCPSSEDMMLAGEIQAQLHIIITLILFSYIYHKHLIAQLFPLLLACIYHQGMEQKANSAFSSQTYAEDCLEFSFFRLSLSSV